MTTTVNDAARPSSSSSGAKRAEWRAISRHSSGNAPLGGRARAARVGHAGLLAGTALLYLVGLGASGYANQFYAAAAQAGSSSWTAFLFGSLDSSNFITVDKPPAALWVIDISVKLFGLNAWSVLVPQALEGVAAVALLYAAVRRISGPSAALLAGAALATTPIAALMFRFDNPDALLVMLMTAAAYATVRAVEKASARWLSLVGVLLGFAFLTKMLQGLFVLPGFALAYLIAAPTTLRRRITHLLIAGGAMVVAAGWWVALVELWPAGSRPYIGGSNHNSVLELIFGYNGLGRLTGSSNNGAVNGGTGGFSSSESGLFRFFDSDMSSQISWLIPAALVALAALLWVTHGRPRTDALRASVVVWGGWLLVTGLVLSFASGIIHAYYTVALAPGIAALVGIGVVELWRRREDDAARWLLGALVASTTIWTYVLWGRVGWHSDVRWLLLTAGAVTTGAVFHGKLSALIITPMVAFSLFAAPSAYALQTALTTHHGAVPTAGPISGSGGFGGRPGGAPAGGPGFGGGTRPGNRGGRAPAGGINPPVTNALGANPLFRSTSVDSALVTALREGSYEWAAATTSDNETSSLELASNRPVMSLGGYNGTDPAITLAAFQKLVAAHKMHYYVPDDQGFIGSTAADTSTAYAIEQWVTSNFTAQTIGDRTVYDLTR